MKLKRLRHGAFVLLKHTLNRLTGRLARSAFGPFSIVRHVGRRSGKLYETPIIVAPLGDGFMIELTYGPDVDWHKNVVAAGGCTIIWHGKDYPIDGIAPVDAETGRAAFSPFQQRILRLLGRQHFEKLTLQRSPQGRPPAP